MDGTGRVPGRVTGVLRRAPGRAVRPGPRLDAVDRAFPTDFPTRRQVVLVEASDLARADDYRPLATPGATRRAARGGAARGPTSSSAGCSGTSTCGATRSWSSRRTTRRGARTLTVGRDPRAARRAPGSSNRRRHGAPASSRSSTSRPRSSTSSTSKPPDVMEGRPARLHAQTGDYRARVDSLVRADRGAQFRDATIGQATAILVAVTITLAVAAGLWFRFARGTPVTQSARVGVARADRVRDRDLPRRPVPVLQVGLGPVLRCSSSSSRSPSPGLCLALGRRGPVDPVLIALGIVVVLHVGRPRHRHAPRSSTPCSATPRPSASGSPGSATRARRR